MFRITFFADSFSWVAHPPEIKVEARDLTEGEAIFVSGKLMDPDFVRKITGRYIPFTSAVATDYARGERGTGEKKTLVLVPKQGEWVLGSLLMKLSPTDLEALDAFEQVPAIRHKTPIRVRTGTIERMATTFIPRE